MKIAVINKKLTNFKFKKEDLMLLIMIIFLDKTIRNKK